MIMERRVNVFLNLIHMVIRDVHTHSSLNKMFFSSMICILKKVCDKIFFSFFQNNLNSHVEKWQFSNPFQSFDYLFRKIHSDVSHTFGKKEQISQE